MTTGSIAPAQKPPANLDGLDPSWSRLVHVAKIDDVGRIWHLLDNQVADPHVTLLCVHGNPSWSYLWRRVVAAAPDGVRVIAVDQLGMGFSERTGDVRRLATRVDDLCALTDELDVTGPVVTIAHDWGGPVSLGWALRHQDQLAGTALRGIVLLNTAVHQPAESPAPAVIRAVRSRGLFRRVTVDTSAFVTGAIEMSRPRLDPGVREGLRAPYASADRREAIADFVADIPLDSEHPSAAALDAIAAGLAELSETPALLLWGPRDPVFSDLYLHDLEQRLPHADVHRFVAASHFVSEDVDVVTPIFDWLGALNQDDPLPAVDESGRGMGIAEVPADDQIAVMDMADDERSITFGELRRQVDSTAAGLYAAGVQPGDRVALMVPPGIELTVVLYACWRMGAVVVLIDSGLGPRGMSRAFAGAAPDYLVGVDRALKAARALRWPGVRFSLAPLSPRMRRVLQVQGDLETMSASTAAVPSPPTADAPAAIVFTSGATGPSKGVLYRHGQIQAGCDVLVELYGITPADRLVAAFAPFALYGPTMGIATVVPAMDVTSPGSLDAPTLGQAARAIDASLVFASPAALANVVKTADQLTDRQRGAFGNVRLLLSAGAPVRPALLRAANDLLANAEVHTPYGMTEVLPVADIRLDEIERSSGGDGVCVGRPVRGVEVRLSGLDDLGEASGELTDEPGVVGEIVVRAPHVCDGYDRLWHTQHLASQPLGWHRTDDVGHLDTDGRLWVGGRIGHVITTPAGPVTPVRIEHAIEEVAEVERAAVVGVGPVGTQVLVAVVELASGVRRPRLADLDLQTTVRATTGLDIAAVFVVPRLPVDRRHNSKIDRTKVARQAARALAGGRMGRR